MHHRARINNWRIQSLRTLLKIKVFHIRGIERLTKQANTLDDTRADPRAAPRRRACKQDAILTRLTIKHVEGILSKPRVTIQKQPAWLAWVELDAEVPRPRNTKIRRNTQHRHLCLIKRAWHTRPVINNENIYLGRQGRDTPLKEVKAI